jgi:AraC-like DNA-binding protein
MISRPLKTVNPANISSQVSELDQNWKSNFLPHFSIFNILLHFLDMPCSLIDLQTGNWLLFNRRYRLLDTVQFEFYFGKTEPRARYNQDCIKKVVQTRKSLAASYRGFWDVFVPVLNKGRVTAVLQSGNFSRTPPTREMLEREWKVITGRKASPLDADFVRFVRTALETPLLESTVLKAFVEILELYAGVLENRQNRESAYQRMEELRREVIAKKFPHNYWVRAVIQSEPYANPPWVWTGGLSKWEREEIGINRIPTVVIAVMPMESSRANRDEIQTLLDASLMRRESFLFAKTLPETVAGDLESYGLVFLTSTDPEKNKTQAKLEIEHRVGKIVDYFEKQFQLKMRVGVGRVAPVGDSLGKSFREAVSALHRCVYLGKPLLFYEDEADQIQRTEASDLQASLNQLVETWSRSLGLEAESARDQYIQKVLLFASERPEAVRVHFQYAIFGILAVLQRRLLLQGEAFQKLSADLSRKLAEAGSTYVLLSTFRESLGVLRAFFNRPADGARNQRLERAKNYIDLNYRQPLTLPKIARQEGFSVSVFTRSFKRLTGLGFAAYRQKLRVEQAKLLLKTTRLPLAQIGQECGFGSTNYFLQIFKKKTGKSPGEFRQNQNA